MSGSSVEFAKETPKNNANDIVSQRDGGQRLQTGQGGREHAPRGYGR